MDRGAGAYGMAASVPAMVAAFVLAIGIIGLFLLILLPFVFGSALAAQLLFNVSYGVILTFVAAGIFAVLSENDIWAQAAIESVFD